MKKLLLTFAISLLATTTFAATLQISVSDPINNIDPFDEVEVKLDTEIAEFYDKKYLFADFNPLLPSQTITFTKDKYLTQTHSIKIKNYEIFFDEQTQPFQRLITTTNEAGETIVDPTNNVILPEIELLPKPEAIILGIITAIQGDILQTIDYTDLGIELTTSFGGTSTAEILQAEGDSDDEYEYGVLGHFGTAEKSREYTLTFTYEPFENVVKTFEVGTESIEYTEKTNIVFDIPTGANSRERLITDMTGFGCNELMPKYLVGANCVENSTLKGDATDIAVWVQKFGGKITGMIGMIAVVLIVWNAFKIVTAAGEEEKISQGKKGIMWTIIGLVLTMFAYVIVKTVIMLAYTQQ